MREENSSPKNKEATLRFKKAAMKVIENWKQEKEKEKAIVPSQKEDDFSGVKEVKVNGTNIPKLNLPAAQDLQNLSPKEMKPARWESTGHHWQKKSDEASEGS